ncbi:MAG TPA: hypothetical protein VGI10_24225 [Polyangiaceae bacterium]|jgi:hypothetical protein
MSELRSWFLRNVFEVLERQLGASALGSLRAKLPPRLAVHASVERLRASAALDSIPLDEGEELLLALDSLLGDGSGKLLETVGTELALRALSQGGGVTRAADLAGTVARLQAFLEHPFVEAPVTFDLQRIPSGFTLSLSVIGRSRSTRVLRSLTAGAVQAASRFTRESGPDTLKLVSDAIADRATLTAHYLQVVEPVAVDSQRSPTRRIPSASVRPAGSLSQQVERILGPSSSPPRRPSDPNQLAVQSDSLPRPPRAPSIPSIDLDPTPPPSSRVHERPSVRFQAPLLQGTTGDKSRR